MMNQVLASLEQYSIYITIGLGVIVIVVILLLVATLMKLKKIQRRYETFMQTDDLDLEKLLIHYAKKVSAVQQSQEAFKGDLQALSDRMQYCTQKTGVVRYNAYGKGGADLSFAVALLDEHDTGVVMNGIYGRDGSYMYAKPIDRGASAHNLSEEEISAIEKAKNYNKAISI